MPEVRFTVQWPDSSVSECYSPSTVVHDFIQSGTRYALDDFMARSRAALNLGSERVRQKYGYACSAAMDELKRLEERAAAFHDDPAAAVVVISVLP